MGTESVSVTADAEELGERATTMTSNSRLPVQVTEELPRELIELAEQIASLPPEYRSRMEPACSRVVDSFRRRRRILELVQEALSQLRLDVKYLMFDLDVTRQERDELREQQDR